MDNLNTVYEIAEELLHIVPRLGRLLALTMRDEDEEETSMMQITVLFHIEHNPLTTSELARHRRVSLQAASALVQSLVERGWVVRIPDPNDRRQSLLQITPEGQARAQAAKHQVANRLAALLENLSPEETDAAKIFLPALNRILMKKLTADDVK
jgi:DNA-binding MarR family transcriptional regulator